MYRVPTKYVDEFNGHVLQLKEIRKKVKTNGMGNLQYRSFTCV
jgi:hypothetical protein